MINFFENATAIILEHGFDYYIKSKESKTINVAIVDQIREELKFNRMINLEILKYYGIIGREYEKADDLVRNLCAEYQTAVYETIKKSFIPLSVVFDGKKPAKEKIGNSLATINLDSVNKKSIETLDSTSDLVRLIYYKIYSIKVYYVTERPKQRWRFKYLDDSINLFLKGIG
ncbi:MAG: hypothetical protein HQK81_00020 [Desulfovibrionaceae bacterium]|nr:hypothetical protein [Desulfovibrionaceae bacterium]MBF0512435.1 hypothetical protein [Desulfovibrionaceae bacterium]